MQIGNREFRPRLWATCLFILIGGTMLLLGRWQLNRAAEKITLMQAASDAVQSEPLAIEQLQHAAVGLQYADDTNLAKNIARQSGEIEAAAGSYKRIRVQGHWLTDRQFLWDNRIHKGVAGYEVITPLRLLQDPSLIVLINRGWLPVGASRSRLPDIAIVASAADPDAGDDNAQTVDLVGMLTMPSRGFAGGDALPADKIAASSGTVWPKVLQYFDYVAIADALQHPLLGGVVQGVEIREVDPVPWLYADNWSPVANGPEKHYGYAFQWFAMFVALFGIYLVTNTSKIVSKNASKNVNK